MIKIGNSDTTIYVGSDIVKKIYEGTTEVYSNDTPTPPTPTPSGYSSQYLTFEIISGGYDITLDTNSSMKYTLQYRKNGGEWTDLTTKSGSIYVDNGDIIEFKGDNPKYRTNYFKTDATFIVYGNIMSIIDSTGFTTADTLNSSNTYAFNPLFKGCTGLTDASNLILPATTLATYCYKEMFKNCTSLNTAPELPAPTLVANCYYYMFQGCTSLNYIKCLATDISASNCTNSWVFNVDTDTGLGTFVKDASMNDWTTGISGIPENWAVQDAN